MFRNYFKTAWRNLLRNKAFSFINIFGLALGMACSLMILLWIREERAMDAFHRNSDRIFNVYERVFSEGKVEAGLWTPGLLARELKRRVPGVRLASGYWQREGEEDVFALGEKRVNLHGAYSTGSTAAPIPISNSTRMSMLRGWKHRSRILWGLICGPTMGVGIISSWDCCGLIKRLSNDGRRSGCER
jgi:hypothetical protein